MSIVSTQWLADHLNDPDLRIVDIRGIVKPATEPPPHYFNKHEDYLRDHIPGAVFIDWVHEITNPADPRHTQIAPPKRYAAAMSRAGIGDDTFVVVYDDGGIFAPRFWWTLNYYGHTQVAVLDGGYSKWTAEGHPITAEVPIVEPTSFTARPNPALRRTADEVLAKLNSDTILLDVRTELEYNGQASRAHRMGHIPGAVNNHRATLIHEDGTLLPPDALRQQFASVGITADSPEVICYCNGGVSASFSLWAMHIAGFENSTLYDGSWKEWGGDDSKPIE